jgi:4-hydroxy-tetrahydrodipicolinate synthase
MNNGSKLHGVVVPLVTPVTAGGRVDEPALDKLIASVLSGGVQGLFVLGTTGEGVNVPKALRRGLLEHVVTMAEGRALVYAGLGDIHSSEFGVTQEYFDAGADVVVAHPPITQRLTEPELLVWYRTLLDQCEGPLVMYNMPVITRMTIPLDLIGELIGHPRFVGIKDSENNAARHTELLERFGKQPGFAIFIGVGALMAQGLRSGADGIVPSVGNLIPDVCQQFYSSAVAGNGSHLDTLFARMNEVAGVYQKGRTLNESLAALKAAIHFRGLCDEYMLPPLKPVPLLEMESIRTEMTRLKLLQ